MKKWILFFPLMYSIAFPILDPVNNVDPNPKLISVSMDGCDIPTSKHGIHGYLRKIAQKISYETESEEDVLMAHSTKRNAVTSLYSLPDSSIYIKSWPSLRMAEIKITYRKELNGLEILDFICELFHPSGFRVLYI